MTFKTLLAATTALVVSAAAAQAAQVAALVGNDTIAIVDTAAKKVTKSMKVEGVSGQIVGIDVRPADNMLYALAADGTLYTIGMDGKAAKKSKLETMLKPGVWATVDFNPAADRLRVMGSDGTSLRVNVDDGKVITDGSHKYADSDASKGKTPKIGAGAYTNSVKGTKETALFNIDLATGALVKQVPPNDGVLNTVGMLGASPKMIAFDIWSDGTRNEAWAMTGADLWSIDLQSGKATKAATIEGIKGDVKDIAILPAM
ncbi:MAG: DUF4394 domain-containing protein [Pseudorhodoplanes sp.]